MSNKMLNISKHKRSTCWSIIFLLDFGWTILDAELFICVKNKKIFFTVIEKFTQRFQIFNEINYLLLKESIVEKESSFSLKFHFQLLEKIYGRN